MNINFRSSKFFNMTISFNFILILVNLSFILLFINFYNDYKFNEFIDKNTLILSIIFSIQNIIFLIVQNKNKNPFILILILIISFFYLLRIITLYSYSYSAVLSRDDITSLEVNQSLFYILISNLFLNIGFLSVGFFFKKNKIEKVNKFSPLKLKSSILLLILVMLLIFINNIGIGSSELMAFFVLLFFHQEAVLLFTFSFVLYYINSISKKYIIIYVLLIIFFIIYVTLAGSRSALLTIFTLFLFSILAVRNDLKINILAFIFSVIIIPVSFLFYLTATFNRGLENKINNPLTLISEMNEQNVFESEKVDFFISRLADRLGFYDYNTILISKPDKYNKVVNAKFYLSSIIDNLLTPGFDIFDTPKASLALGAVANNENAIKKSKIGESYQSDMLGIFGEYSVLFNKYFSLLLFFATAFIFQYFYNFFEIFNDFKSILFKSLLLSIFYTWVNSFGIDWIIIEAFTMFVTGFFIKRFYY